MSEPPARGDRGEDFRTLPDRHTEGEPLIDALVRDIRSRQAVVRAVLVDEEEATPLPFIGSMSRENGVGPVLASMRQVLNLDLAEFRRSEEHTSELQSLMRISYAVFCLKKKNTKLTSKDQHIINLTINRKENRHETC